MCFDANDEQRIDVQAAVNCHTIDPVIAQRALDESEVFYIAHWCGWQHEITKREMEYLLGLRTLALDTAAAWKSA